MVSTVMRALMLSASVSTAREASGPGIWQNQTVFKWVRDEFKALNEGSLDQAHSLYDRALKRTWHPYEVSYARYGLSAVLLEQGHEDQALILLEQVVADNRLPDLEHNSAIDSLISHYLAQGHR